MVIKLKLKTKAVTARIALSIDIRNLSRITFCIIVATLYSGLSDESWVVHITPQRRVLIVILAILRQLFDQIG